MDRYDEKARVLVGHAQADCPEECRNCEKVAMIAQALREAAAEALEESARILALDVQKMDCAKDKRLLAAEIQVIRGNAAALSAPQRAPSCEICGNAHGDKCQAWPQPDPGEAMTLEIILMCAEIER